MIDSYYNDIKTILSRIDRIQGSDSVPVAGQDSTVEQAYEYHIKNNIPIKKEQYHQLIPGDTKLIIEITKNFK